MKIQEKKNDEDPINNQDRVFQRHGIYLFLNWDGEYTSIHFTVVVWTVHSNQIYTVLQPSRLKPARFLCSWDFPGRNTGVDCHFLPQGIYLTQGWAHISCPEKGFFTIWATREAVYSPLRNSTLGQEAKSHKFTITCQVQDFLLTKLYDSVLPDTFLTPILVYHSKTEPFKMTHI